MRSLLGRVGGACGRESIYPGTEGIRAQWIIQDSSGIVHNSADRHSLHPQQPALLTIVPERIVPTPTPQLGTDSILTGCEGSVVRFDV